MLCSLGNWKGKRHGAVGDGVEKKMAELMDSEAEELWRPGVGWYMVNFMDL